MTGRIETRDDRVSFRKVTWETIYDIDALKPAPEQIDYVSSNALSMAQASFNPGAWYRAVYADETPVGFFMLYDPLRPGALPRELMDPGDINLWRFMIDKRYQGLGFGSRALNMICDQVAKMPGTPGLTSSFIPGKHGPEAFYLNYGFKKTGRFRSDRKEVEIRFQP